MAVVEETSLQRRSLEEVHGSVAVPRGTARRLRQFLAYLGPAYLVSVGYMVTGYWATDMDRADLGMVVLGLPASLPPVALYVAICILCATIMPHNFYLYSALVQTRRIGTDRESKAIACRYYLLDSTIALNAAFFVNAAILV